MPKIDPKREAKEFGRRLVALLERHGQPRRGAGAYLAKRYKVSSVVANAWLNGEYKPEIPKARAMADEHGVAFEELYFGGTPDPSAGSGSASIRSDIDALEYALGAMASLLSLHRPAEALELAANLERAPDHVRDSDLMQALRAALVSRGAARRNPA